MSKKLDNLITDFMKDVNVSSAGVDRWDTAAFQGRINQFVKDVNDLYKQDKIANIATIFDFMPVRVYGKNRFQNSETNGWWHVVYLNWDTPLEHLSWAYQIDEERIALFNAQKKVACVNDEGGKYFNEGLDTTPPDRLSKEEMRYKNKEAVDDMPQ